MIPWSIDCMPSWTTLALLVTSVQQHEQFLINAWNSFDSTVRGDGEVGSARYEPALLPPCPSIRALSYSNCQRSTQSRQLQQLQATHKRVTVLIPSLQAHNTMPLCHICCHLCSPSQIRLVLIWQTKSQWNWTYCWRCMVLTGIILSRCAVGRDMSNRNCVKVFVGKSSKCTVRPSSWQEHECPKGNIVHTEA